MPASRSSISCSSPTAWVKTPSPPICFFGVLRETRERKKSEVSEVQVRHDLQAPIGQSKAQSCLNPIDLHHHMTPDQALRPLKE
ncbi:hypothetical protein PVAP13_2KG428905 [Panicum virgatum]|uniref:Uncharacterized protein n=1 Tax=Panicum virgatum TaxID=38727 RepID=A0A8T0WDU9_PANVG|nr:hypothetical protein PVAP13_2KG428905 [Panicum virgatum]